jgi:hypothetical protein
MLMNILSFAAFWAIAFALHFESERRRFCQIFVQLSEAGMFGRFEYTLAQLNQFSKANVAHDEDKQTELNRSPMDKQRVSAE